MLPPNDPHRQRPAEQPAGDHRRAAAPGAHRHYRPVRLGEELAGVRHPVRRRAAAVHRVALDVRQAVSRADAQAAGGSPRGDRAVGRHRAAQPHRQQPLHRRHRHRSLRLPPSALGPRRPELLPCLRRARAAGHPAERGRRCVCRGSRRAPAGGLPAAAGGAAHARCGGREPPRPGLRPGAGGRHSAPSRRAAARPRPHRRRRAARRRRPPGGGAFVRRTPGRIGRDRLSGGRGDRGRAPFPTPVGAGPAPIHSVPRLQRLRHAGRHGHARSLLLQQPARRLRPVQRFRRGPRVRRVARRP